MKANIPRLKKLIVALKGAKKEDFSMVTFGNACGTPACVLGHYAARRDLQRTFKFAKAEAGDYAPRVLSSADHGAMGYNAFAVREHFGVALSEGDELFSDFGCNGAQTPKQAIAYIRKFIARKEREARK